MTSALILLALFALLLSGCGSSAKPTLTIGAGETTEEEILAEIYAIALRDAGYQVPQVVHLALEEAPAALRSGKLSGYPSHLSTPDSLKWALPSEVPSPSPRRALEEMRAGLAAEGLTVFPPTPFSFTNLLVARRFFAEKLGLTRFTDLLHREEPLTIAGVRGCHQALNCMAGLETIYRPPSVGFVTALESTSEVLGALEAGTADLAFVPSTDGHLASERRKLVVLAEDRHRFPAGNAVFVTRPNVVDAAGPDFEAAIIGAQHGLTLSVVQELDAKVELGGRDPASVAAEYMRTTVGPG